MGSTIRIVTFDDPEKAGEVYKSVKELEKEKLVLVKDAVVLAKDSAGKVHVKETDDVSKTRGAAVGGSLGFVIGLMIGGPIGGALLGMAAGFFTASKVDLGISKDKIEAVASDLKPDTSALFLQIESVQKEGLLQALMRENNGKIYEVELSDDHEADIEDAISGSVARH